jgi:histone deacetylase 4/5
MLPTKYPTKYPRVGYVYDPAMTLHRANVDHPECPERIQEIYKCLMNKDLISKMIAVKSREATHDELKIAHSEQYLSTLEWKLRGPKGVRSQLTEQSNSIYVNESTLMCAKLAAGSTLELASKVADGHLNSGVAIVRPPGHHAGSKAAMGFCIYSNVAIAAKHLARQGHRVLIVDWDVHKGNGTEEIVSNCANILFFSVHRSNGGKFYPMTPDLSATNIVNVGLDGYIGDEEYLSALEDFLVPEATKFGPNIILISGGFDACEKDPLGGSHLTANCYRQMTCLLQTISTRIVLVLEGGYHLKNIAEAFSQCTEALLGIN